MKLPLLAIVVYLAVSSPKPIQLRVSPQVSFAPTTLTIRVWVHPHADDTWLAIESSDGSQRSVLSLDPNRTVYDRLWKDVGPGEVDVIASIGHQAHVCASDRQSVIVTAP